MPFVFQYGSNCDAARLNGLGRLGGAAEDRGKAQTVAEFEIAFDVWSQGNACAAADLVEAAGSGHHAWGVLYEIPADRIDRMSSRGKRTLSDIEGTRYQPVQIRVGEITGKEVDAITFTVKKESKAKGLWTTARYVAHIVNGLRAHGVPEEYVQHVIDAAIRQNQSAENAAALETTLLSELRMGHAP